MRRRQITAGKIKKILKDNDSKLVAPGSISWMFNQTVTINDSEINKALDTLFEALDDNDDVEDVATNIQED